ncbi:MAG TPA: FAD-dependent oxidoreductase [Caldimonas sp.]|jgi:2-polyprenyl-6-methoxyphenol hydroxylase-like FAD-dependent oxidoreductase|nr:FAD-dependent oxidoreductase [Caldimonas sp.]HEX2542242.1 FAD-dependent oxidoreductase [Caldimonas sp.]
MPAERTLSAQCCIAGGGPAGMMLGLLLARAGVETVVLEKHADFLRDFRGDTVHPSTLRVMDELGLLDEFLKLPHQKLRRVGGLFGDVPLRLADFGGLPERYAFIAFMPQWDFLDFIGDVGRPLPAFSVRMRSTVESLLHEGGRVAGVRASDENGPFEVLAPLTVACDGRHSVLRAAAGLPLEDIGAPIDVLWFRVTRDPDVFDDTLARVTTGRFVVTLDRGDYWQCAFVIAKGGAEVLQSRGIEAFRADVARAAPVLAAHVRDIASWDDVKLLSVSVDRLTRWSRPGLLCIGDAAHAMSPVGGVGINLAIQDAVATANLLAVKLRNRSLGDEDLEAVRRRRLFPTRVTQALQVQIQSNVLAPVVVTGENAALEVPLPLRVVSALPPLQRLFARVLGLGVRPEHVESPVA